MSTYIQPKIMSIKQDSLIDLMGPVATQYGQLDIGACRQAEAFLGQPNKKIVICKIVEQEPVKVVKIG